MPVFSLGLRLEGQKRSDAVRERRALLDRIHTLTEKETDMKTRMFRICAISAIGLAASLSTLQAQERGALDGVWVVNVTVTNCQTGALIRTVGSLQAFHRDGSLVETANTASRGISEGTWHPLGDHMYDATYWFFRYTATGTFASIAKVTDKITLRSDEKFTSAGFVQDFDAD